ncbi:07e2d06f-0f1a-4817-b94b-a3839b216dd0 [Sclerotinia trifoliorum]|uniref:07e2d06f-0f1a-4817-b94b-a3839b216dd0 n=1 Tax=Sclerotinia trifoliorum TaxID=28548 RepID=A0A8H2VWE4_9HELO|nr:07e2d06f-0f1a-4817-b94b-a3839b216dd0 [Sclerotinia trifoliorum]
MEHNIIRSVLYYTVCVLLVGYIVHNARLWFEKMSWLFVGPQLLAKKYISGVPFTIQTPERQYVLVSSEAHMKELSQAKEERLSLVATAIEVFQPSHTMNGVELNRLGLQHRILRALSLSLSTYQEPLVCLAQAALAKEIKGGNGMEGWTTTSIFNLSQSVVAKANTYTFYGENFTQDEVFLDAATQYPMDVFVAAEAIRCVPSFMAPMVASLVTRRHKASTVLMNKLVPYINERTKDPQSRKFTTQRDYIQHIIELFPEDTPDRAEKMVKQTLALWFASTLFYALVDLCTHTEYQEPLVKEIEENIARYGTLNLSKLTLMDSFLQESARVNASESISLRRKAMGSYVFKDGYHVKDGDWICVPQRAIMRDPTIYSQPEVFDAFRFVNRSETRHSSSNTSRFTDIRTFFPFWGLGKQACPGRFYADFIIKIVLADILQNYNIRIREVSKRRTFTWRSSIMPLPTAQFDIRLKRRCT